MLTLVERLKIVPQVVTVAWIGIRPWRGAAMVALEEIEAIADGCGSFTAPLDGSNLDHLTSLSIGRERGTGFGTAPSA